MESAQAIAARFRNSYGNTLEFIYLRGKLYDIIQKEGIFKIGELRESFDLMDIHWSDCRLAVSGDTPLHVAARVGYLPMVRYLVDFWKGRKLNLEERNAVGKTCLHDAAQMGRFDVVKYLIKKGAKVNTLKAGDWTPLMLACTKHITPAFHTIEALLALGADPLLKNKDGWTALHVACREGDEDIIDILLKHCPELASLHTNNGRTPLHIATLHGHRLVIIRLLEENKSLLEKTDTCGFTPLLEAIRGKHLDIIKFLIKQGADTSASDKMGRGCLHLAAETGDVEIVRYFILDESFNVDDQRDDNKLTPLHCAIRCGQKETAKLLRQFRASTTIKDRIGRTAKDFYYGSFTSEMSALLKRTV